MSRPRRPAGTPTGGQFAPTSRREATGITLTGDDLVEAIAPAEHDTTTPSESSASKQAPVKTTAQRLAALSRFTDYGPEHDRNVVSALSDHHHFARLGEHDNAEHYLLLAEARAGLYTWEQFLQRDPFERIARERRAADAREAAEVLRLTGEEIPVGAIAPGDLVWHNGSFYEVTDDPESAVSAGQVLQRFPVQRHGSPGATDRIHHLDLAPNDVVTGWHYRGDEEHRVDDLEAAEKAASVLSPEALIEAADEARMLQEPVDTANTSPGRPARPPAKEGIARLFPDGEPQRGRRGHKLLPHELLEQIPEPYETEGTPLADKVIYAHYFTASADWHIVELNRETGEMFGRCDLGLGFPEWGYVRIQDLAELQGQFGLPVERELDFDPKTPRELGLVKPSTTPP